MNHDSQDIKLRERVKILLGNQKSCRGIFVFCGEVDSQDYFFKCQKYSNYNKLKLNRKTTEKQPPTLGQENLPLLGWNSFPQTS